MTLAAKVALNPKTTINSLPNDAILGMSKLKDSAGDKFGVAEIMGFVCERLENIVEKEKMLDTCIFSFCFNVLKRLLTLGR